MADMGIKNVFGQIMGICLIGFLSQGCGFSGQQPDAVNPTLETIMSRKSVRQFQERPVEAEKVDWLLRSAMAAPSGKDLRPWSFVVIDQRERLDSLAEALPTAKMLRQAPMAIVVCGDETRSFYWYLDCSAATQNILLAAESLGLGAVWTATYPYPDRMRIVADQLALPDRIKSLCVIPVGYPAGETSPKDKWSEDCIHQNKW